MHKKIKKIGIVLAIIAALILTAVFLMVKNKPQTVYTTVPIEKGTIIQTVSETGTVKSASGIDLNFLNAGKIASINCRIGDKVAEGQVLAALDCGDLLKRKDEAVANLDLVNASHNKLLAGASREDINISKSGVAQAKTAYEAAEKNLIKIKNTVAENIRQANKTLSDLESKSVSDITTSEQAIISAETNLNNIRATYQRSIDIYEESAITVIQDKLTIANNALDAVSKIADDEDLKDFLSVKNVSYRDIVNNSRLEARALLAIAENSLANAKNGADSDYIIKTIGDSLSALNKTYQTLLNTFTALENTITSSALSQSELDALKSGITAQQTLASAGISALQAARQNLEKAMLDYNTNVSSASASLDQAQVAYDNAVKTARNGLSSAEIDGERQITAAQAQSDSAFEAWQVAQSQYNRTIAPANRQDILVSEAKIRQAQAALDTIAKNIDNCYIKAPITGTITKVNYEAGEMPSGKPVISMLGENNFEIEVLVSEADIAKVNGGDPAEITLDAFGDELKFAGSASFIEPAETVIQDVIYYKVSVIFSEQNESAALQNIKSGMTANVTITTAKKDNVLVMPNRAVIDKNGSGKFTRILANNIVEERPITIGLRGDGGLVEILAGAQEGERVVTYVGEK